MHMHVHVCIHTYTHMYICIIKMTPKLIIKLPVIFWYMSFYSCICVIKFTLTCIFKKFIHTHIFLNIRICKL